MYLLEIVEPGQNCEVTKSDQTKKSKHVFKTVIVSSVFRNQNVTLRMSLVWLKNAFRYIISVGYLKYQYQLCDVILYLG